MYFKIQFHNSKQNKAQLCMCNIALLNIYSLYLGETSDFFTEQFA